MLRNEQEVDAAQARVANPYITQPVCCPLTAQQRQNIERIQVISIDSYPNLALKFYKYVNTDIQIPQGSTVEHRVCNPHVNYVVSSLLGVNNKEIPIYQGMRVTFIPAISCIGNAWEPDVVLALQAAQKLAQQNAALGINTIVSYPIGGAYYTSEKIAAVQALANTPRTYFMMSSGNNDQGNYCSWPTENIPGIYVIGASNNGNQLSSYGNIGACVKFYTPGKYKSVVDGKVIWGTSFSEPIAANLFIHMLLAFPDASKDELLAKVAATSNVVSAPTLSGNNININIFPTAKVCTTPAIVTAPKPMLTQFNSKSSSSYCEVSDEMLLNPIAVAEAPKCAYKPG